MKDFFKLKTVREVLALIQASFQPVESEIANLAESAGRVLAEDLAAPHDIPTFARSSMDGYAVQARDTFGATENLPALLTVVGEAPMGVAPSFAIKPGRTARIWTGGMLPQGADAVVMIEHAHPLDSETVELARAVSPLENVIQPGDDIKAGTILLRRGMTLRPQDVGLLAGLGIGRVPVYRRLKAAVISSGDELIDPDDPLEPGKVRDMNTYTLAARLEALGVETTRLGVVPDRYESLREAVEDGLACCDLVLLSGGSSMGARDYTVKVFKSFPETRLLVHGVAIKPGKPTIIAQQGNRALWGLPGHVTSALVIFSIMVEPLIGRLSGKIDSGRRAITVKAALERNLESAPGREDYIRVKIVQTDNGLKARPVLGKSGLISTMVEADGLIRIPLEAEGLYAGDEVEVIPFERDYGGH